MAAATRLFEYYPSDAGSDPDGLAAQRALQTAEANGFSALGGADITVRIPPTSGIYAGKAGYAEVMSHSSG